MTKGMGQEHVPRRMCYGHAIESEAADCSVCSGNDRGFTVEHGVIRDPGKFEGEPPYVVELWDRWLNGFSDDEIEVDGIWVSIFDPTFDEAERWELGPETEHIALWTSDQGFVCTSELTRDQLRIAKRDCPVCDSLGGIECPECVAKHWDSLEHENEHVRRAMLVYQTGLANVFEVDSFNLAEYGRNARRLLQADFRTCEAFARGFGAAGGIVRTAACNQAGDILRSRWTEDLDSQPFSGNHCPVNCN